MCAFLWRRPHPILFRKTPVSAMAYTLLTGSTGFLGRYLLRDCLLAEVPLAVLVRSSKRETAQARMESVMAHWEQQLGRSLVRPVLIEGDVRLDNCGIAEPQLRWLETNANTIIHSAASMNFHAAKPGGEPYESNIGGTTRLLAVCEATGIRHFHQVSTAYICGLRQGKILESELDLGQTNGNDYERSKLAAEKLIRQASFLASATFYRPASVIGDSQSGYTTNFHGFYSPLQVLYSMAKGLLGLGDVGRQIIDDVTRRARFMDRLNLAGTEGKNLVPVDWVAAVIVHVLQHPELHGETYHLTPRERSTVKEVSEVFEQVMREYAGIQEGVELPPIEVPAAEREAVERVFREQMNTYDSHWRDDPYFDCANTMRAAPHLPCPVADREMLLRTARFAVKGNFGWPKPQPVKVEFNASERLQPWVERHVNGAAHRLVGLQVIGRGGGQWSMAVDGVTPLAARVGLAADCQATYWLTSGTLAALMNHELTVEAAVYSGGVLIEGNNASDHAQLEILRNVVARQVA
jgi:thioester reductase-like protein